MVVLHWGIEGLTQGIEKLRGSPGIEELTWGRRQCEKLTQAHTRSCECPGRREFVSIIIIIIGSSSIIIIIFKHIQRKAIVIFTSTFCVKLLESGQNNSLDQYIWESTSKVAKSVLNMTLSSRGMGAWEKTYLIFFQILRTENGKWRFEICKNTKEFRKYEV